MSGSGDVFTQLHVVGDLDLVVQLDSVFNDRGSKCRPVDCCGGTYFTPIADGDIAGLRYFIVFARAVGCESESIRTNDGSGLDNAIAADGAMVEYGHLAMERGVGTDANSTYYAHVAVDLTAAGNFGPRFHYSKRPNVAVLIYL